MISLDPAESTCKWHCSKKSNSYSWCKNEQGGQSTPPGYATVLRIDETDNEPPFRVFKFLTPKKFFPPDFHFFRGEHMLPLATPLICERSFIGFLCLAVVTSVLNHSTLEFFQKSPGS